MSKEFQGLIGWGLQYSSIIVETHWNQGYARQTATVEFCAAIFLVYLAIDADTSKRKKVCKQIMDKLSDLEDLIKKKQDSYTVGKV